MHIHRFILKTNFHVKFLLNFHVNHKSLVVKEVLALNGVLVNLALVLDVGVAAVLVVLHEPHLGPLHLPLHSELSLLVPADSREVSTVCAGLDDQSEVRLTKWEGSFIPATELGDRFNVKRRQA